MHIHIQTYTRISIPTHTYSHTPKIHTYTYTPTHLHLHTCTPTHLHLHLHTYTPTHLHLHIHRRTYTQHLLDCDMHGKDASGNPLLKDIGPFLRKKLKVRGGYYCHVGGISMWILLLCAMSAAFEHNRKHLHIPMLNTYPLPKCHTYTQEHVKDVDVKYIDPSYMIRSVKPIATDAVYVR